MVDLNLLEYKDKYREFVTKYLENRKITKLDAFLNLKQGALCSTISKIEARSKKPNKRGKYKNWEYNQSQMVYLDKRSKMMFMERHSKFPEFYLFCPIGGLPVWVDMSRFIDHITILKLPKRKKILDQFYK